MTKRNGETIVFEQKERSKPKWNCRDEKTASIHQFQWKDQIKKLFLSFSFVLSRSAENICSVEEGDINSKNKRMNEQRNEKRSTHSLI